MVPGDSRNRHSQGAGKDTIWKGAIAMHIVEVSQELDRILEQARVQEFIQRKLPGECFGTMYKAIDSLARSVRLTVLSDQQEAGFKDSRP